MNIVPVSVQEKAAFAERMKPVWAQFEGRIGKGVIEEAVAAQGANRSAGASPGLPSFASSDERSG